VSNKIKCATHGDCGSAMVCGHILQTLRDEQPRGFLWAIDDEGEYQAICPSCDDLSDAEWEASVKGAAVICLECFKLAAAYNGVRLDGVSIQ
jgi:hypothetical protein